MEIRVLPVHLAGSAWHVFPQENQQLLVTMEPGETLSQVRSMHQRLRESVRVPATFLEPAAVDERITAAELKRLSAEADALVLNLSCAIDPQILDIGKPVIVFAGERTPMMALYSAPAAVRRRMPWIRLALDYRDLDRELVRVAMSRVLARLRGARMLVLGEYRCFERLPDPGRLRERLGVEIQQLSSAEFLARADGIDDERIASLAQQWLADAAAAQEPDREDLNSAARLFLALSDHMSESGSAAVSVGCLEIMYQHQRRPFCFVLATLRDLGLPAGCESDATATLTMLILELIAERPAYMGNLVLADPDENLVAISHGCSPRFMFGRDAPPLPYRLVHSHSVPPFSRETTGGAGLTSYVDYAQRGQPVTICRIDAGLEDFFVCSGEIVDCRDTICDRTTLSLRVDDARAFVREASGNHQVVIYGDFLREIGAFCELAGIRVTGPGAAGSAQGASR